MGRGPVQRRPLDRDAARRPFRGDGGTGIARSGYTGLLRESKIGNHPIEIQGRRSVAVVMLLSEFGRVLRGYGIQTELR